MRDVILTAALTGGLHGKEANPNLPVSPQEIVEDGLASVEAGASILHIHVRDPEGNPTADLDIVNKIVEDLKSNTDAIIQLSTGVGVGVPVEERKNIIEARPDMASLNTSMVVFFHKGKEYLWENYRSQIEEFARKMKDKDVKPELECYNIESLYEVKNLIDKDLVSKPYYFNLCLGLPAQGAIKASPKNLQRFCEALPEDAIFNVTAPGPHQLPLTTIGTLLGGHCRVGLEDNVYYAKGELAESNAQLVKRSARIIEELNLNVAEPAKAREILEVEKI